MHMSVPVDMINLYSRRDDLTDLCLSFHFDLYKQILSSREIRQIEKIKEGMLKKLLFVDQQWYRGLVQSGFVIG